MSTAVAVLSNTEDMVDGGADAGIPEDEAAEKETKEEDAAPPQITEEDRKKYANWPVKDIKEPHPNDVLYGRGGMFICLFILRRILLPILHAWKIVILCGMFISQYILLYSLSMYYPTYNQFHRWHQSSCGQQTLSQNGRRPQSRLCPL